MSVLEVKEGKLEEALTRARNALVMFHNIQGFECAIDVHSTVAEGLTSLGMSVPD